MEQRTPQPHPSGSGTSGGGAAGTTSTGRGQHSRPPKSASSASLRQQQYSTQQRRTRRTSMDTSDSAMTYHPEGQGQGYRTPSRRTSVADQSVTPTRNMVSLDSTGTSPGAMRRGSTLPSSSDRPSSSSTATQRTMTAGGSGYGSTSTTPHGSLTALGFGGPSGSKQPDALASPRRISTSHSAVGFARRSQSPAPLAPSHEAYYSQTQPPTATTPRFRNNRDILAQAQSQGGSPYTIGEHFLQPAVTLHRRQQSNGSGLLAAPSGPSSPVGSVFKSLRRQASNIGISIGKPVAYDDDARKDSDTEDEEPAQTANGTRVWYSSYVTIDWLHDAIKESTRVRRLRHSSKRSLRGAIANNWDRLQGWVAATLIGILSAVIAFLIIRTEMALFDLKEGFCSSSWGTSKRFCCTPHNRAPSPDDICGDWVEWGELLNPKDKSTWYLGMAEFMPYTMIALGLATLASCLTIYLSSSAHHTTAKDSQLLIPSPKAQHHTPLPKPSERQPLLDGDVLSPLQELQIKAEPARKVMYYAAGSGIPEIKTILSGFVIHGYLGGWTLLTKSIGLALSVASGLSLGKEGPLVHISSCVGNIVSRFFIKFECNEAKRREVLSAACAAGVAVAFGAPIGGVLFSLEEVSYYFPPKVMWRSFWCAAVAALTLKSLNPFGNGSIVLFAVTYTKQYHYWEFAIFILLGIFGGVYGAIFSRLNILWARHIRQGTWVKNHPIVEVALVTALTTALSFLNPYCRMGGTELVASLFAECKEDTVSSLCVEHPHEIGRVILLVGLALVIKGGLTIITFGIKLPAGIFIPSLVVGACFGRIVGLVMEYIEYSHPTLGIFDVCRETDCIVPGLYAMIGAAATLAGVTRTTVSLAVIVLELTNTLNYVVPIVLAVLIAKTVADGLEKKGIYDLVIDLNQLPYLDAKHEYLWGSRMVSEVAERDVPTLRLDKPHTVRSLTGKLLELARLGAADTGFPILAKEPISEDGRTFGVMRVMGFLGMNELEHALSALADEPDKHVTLLSDEGKSSRPRSSVLSMFSFTEEPGDRKDPYDLSKYVDRAPITVQTHSSLELVQQLFVKLGARQIIVTDARGIFRGIITKKAWLTFLTEIEEVAH